MAGIFNPYRINMPMATNNPVQQNLYEVSGTKYHDVGEYLWLADGTVYRYASFTTAITRGFLVQSTDALDNAVTAAVTSVGATSVAVSGVATNFGENTLKGGYFCAASIDRYSITGNTAFSGNAGTIYLGEPLRTALATTASAQRIYPNPYRLAIVSTATTDIITGVTIADITAAQLAASTTVYSWVQTKGPCAVIPDSSTLIVNGLVQPSGDNGKVGVYVEGTVEMPLGLARSVIAAEDEVLLIDLYDINR